jgi:DNA end-binding protein Ku
VKNPPKVSANEKKMASSLVENMSSDFAPESFTDDYQEQLRTLVAAKLEQGDALDTAATFGEEGEAPEPGQVIDLVEALRRSVEANRQKRAGGGSSVSSASKESGDREGGARKTPAKKAAAKKAPAKKAAATKTPAKKSTAKKSA